MKSDNFKAALQEHNKFINEEIQMIENGAKVSLLRKEIKPRERDLRKELMTVTISLFSLLAMSPTLEK